jgi:uncharacterized surface protein with fasciclin (FAS1) repeats
MRGVSSILLLVLLTWSCQQELADLEKYQAPSWLKGKLYTQIVAQPDLKYFSEALRITGMDTIINTSGLFTVFAPNDNAFTEYFALNPQFGGEVKNMPEEFLQDLVNYHIVQNSWSRLQMTSVNLNGWIDRDGIRVNQRAYKKESLLKEKNKKYFLSLDEDNRYIIKASSDNYFRNVLTQSRKYVPVFYKEYFETYGIHHSDYEFYFGRPYDGGIHFAGSKVLNDQEIPAENGYVYIIDKVIEPLLNAEQLLESEETGRSYKKFLSLIHEFPAFTANMEATYQQIGADEGMVVDTLFNLNYPELTFNINSEITDPLRTRNIASIQHHNTLFAPTDEAFDNFVATFISGHNQWGNLSNVPRSIKSIIINSHMVADVIYKSDIDKGFLNGEYDDLTIPDNDIIQSEFGSNATFIGLNKAIVPRAFSSVSAPVYLRRGYFTMMSVIEATRILAALKIKEQNFSFFVVPDLAPGTLVDSSLIVRTINNQITFSAFDRGEEVLRNNVPISDLRKKLLNHVGTSLPTGIGSVEFVKNLAGNYIVFDNINNTVSGTAPTTFGLNGDSVINVHAKLLEEHTDNGKTYEIESWFSFAKATMTSRILSINIQFLDLLVKAGLATKLIGNEYNLGFLSQGTQYTAFIPTPQALNAYNTDTLSIPELAQFLRNHFIPGHLIFTDGKATSGDYPTMNIGQERRLNLSTGPDFISMKNNTNGEHVRLEFTPGITNLTSTTNIGATNPNLEWNFITTGVVHAIDKVLESKIIY